LRKYERNLHRRVPGLVYYPTLCHNCGRSYKETNPRGYELLFCTACATEYDVRLRAAEEAEKAPQNAPETPSTGLST